MHLIFSCSPPKVILRSNRKTSRALLEVGDRLVPASSAVASPGGGGRVTTHVNASSSCGASTNTTSGETPNASPTFTTSTLTTVPTLPEVSAAVSLLPPTGTTTTPAATSQGTLITPVCLPAVVAQPATSFISPSDLLPVTSTPLVIRIPASLKDVRRGLTLEQGYDGLARPLPVPTFTAAELVTLDGLVGQQAVQELLLPASERGISLPNLGDIQVHIERETGPLFKQLIEELQIKVTNSAVITPSGLMDFIMEHCRFEGHWPRLQQILECYWSHTSTPGDTRTRVVLQARDLDDDNYDPYVPSVQRESADCALLTSGQAAQALSRLAQAMTSSPPSGHRSLPQESDSNEARRELVDFTACEHSGSRQLILKSQVERSSLQLLPQRHVPMNVKPLDMSPSAVTELDATYAEPNSLSWSGTRADVRELMLGGLSFWVAVETAGKAQVLHDKFSLLALIRMLGSAIYWEVLDSTPWMRYTFAESASIIIINWGLTRKSSTSSRGPGNNKKTRRDSQLPGQGTERPPKFALKPMTPADTYVETPGEGSTWLHFGIMVRRYSSQTLGFPNYTARIENKAIRGRWDPFEYLDLLDTKPWKAMWENRIDALVFFCYQDLTPDMIRGLSWIINFMERWMCEYWERGHWVTITIIFYFHRDSRFLALNGRRQKEILNLYNDRKARSTAFSKAKEELICKLRKLHGYDDDIGFEAGLWVVPENPCDWIWRHPAQQISLQEQLEELDILEPARTQWATRGLDDCLLEVAPSELRDQMLIKHERAENRLPEPTSASASDVARHYARQ
ncbi:unnamed protein product [Phytophthora fragariaefolia]|uniref:Unnamed protein product n=1 Tax=Phytophthora fragariaefolia TaxID=1490495 RepID=A0A9W7D7Q9_9STRA|nr:unnamed protein product [Phytophthora fragariaefolia]